MAGQANWEPDILAFERQDRERFPPKGAILFAGSSTMVRWNLALHFPGVPTINRGFGGSQIRDSLFYAPRIVLPYQPRLIVFYAGENDLAFGNPPDRVEADYRAFVALVRRALPETVVLFLSIKPCPSRWPLWPVMGDMNARIRTFSASDPHLDYLDVATPMLGSDGRPRPELFKADALHLSEAGYALWSARLRPWLARRPAENR